jgi:hypothetical protein
MIGAIPSLIITGRLSDNKLPVNTSEKQEELESITKKDKKTPIIIPHRKLLSKKERKPLNKSFALTNLRSPPVSSPRTPKPSLTKLKAPSSSLQPSRSRLSTSGPITRASSSTTRRDSVSTKAKKRPTSSARENLTPSTTSWR